VALCGSFGSKFTADNEASSEPHWSSSVAKVGLQRRTVLTISSTLAASETYISSVVRADRSAACYLRFFTRRNDQARDEREPHAHDLRCQFVHAAPLRAHFLLSPSTSRSYAIGCSGNRLWGRVQSHVSFQASTVPEGTHRPHVFVQGVVTCRHPVIKQRWRWT